MNFFSAKYALGKAELQIPNLQVGRKWGKGVGGGCHQVSGVCVDTTYAEDFFNKNFDWWGVGF